MTKWLNKNWSILIILAIIAGCSTSMANKKIDFDLPEVTLPAFKSDTFNIIDYGATKGEIEKNTQAINKAIQMCSESGGGVVFIPAGLWETGPIVMKSNVNLHAAKGALVQFSKNHDDYPLIRATYEGTESWRCQSPISGHDLQNIAFTGKGIYDGSGQTWRPVKKLKLTSSEWSDLIASGGFVDEAGKMWYPNEKSFFGSKYNPADSSKEEFEKVKDFLRPVMVAIVKCNTILFDGPTFQNSPAWCIHPLMCENITFKNTNVRNPWFAQNGDGLDLESCKNGIVSNCTFDVGDDAICIKSGKDAEGRKRAMPSENFLVENCVVYHGHGGFVVGSEMSGGVRNFIVRNCTFLGTDIGLRFKSTRGRGGVVENIFISDINMIDIPASAISFNLFYSGNSPIPDADEKKEIAKVISAEAKIVADEMTPSFRDIHIQNITCNGAEQAMLFQGLPEMKVKNVIIENVVMKTKKGIHLSQVENISLKNVSIDSEEEGFKTSDIDGLNTKDVVINGKKL